MWQSNRMVLLASVLLLIQFTISYASPQQAYRISPVNGELQPLNDVQSACGKCPEGTQRETVSGPYCGRCIAPSQTCAFGNYMVNGQCQSCPCPGTNGERKFGTACRVEADGQVTCDCPSEYTGRDCSQCAPGAIQSNQYPYNCVRQNSTNSFQVTCPLGNRCNLPQIPEIVQQRPGCPYTSPPNGNGCPLTNQTGLCPGNGCQQTPCQNGGCPGGTPCQNGGCPGGTPCQNGGCPGGTPCQNGGCPGGTPCQNGGCPGGTPCQNGGCPGGTPCQNGGCQGGTPCQNGGCQGGAPCQNGGCQGPCPNPCQPCPEIPPCPGCELTCPPCPAIQPCPQCKDGECQPCPSVCQACPNPCQPCPKNECPDCRVTCPKCPICDENGIIYPPPPENIEPCICDPRGTMAQTGSQCICKVNVQGARCDQCKAGYFGLSSSRPEGCLACFCSGLSKSCSLTPYYRATIRTDRSDNCTVELTDQNHSVVYSKGSPGYTWDGQTATFTKGTTTRLFWSLPSCLKGDRVTSYGGLLSFARMCSGIGTSLGADHEVMLVGGSGATIFWTSFEDQKCDGRWNSVDVLLAETAFWSSWKGERYRRATRGDVLEVLADLQLILIRATFSTNTMTTSIRNISLSTVSHSASPEGVALQVESCRCPTGYRGLSCENCAPGYYRDTTDMTVSVFGTCKPCPCGKTSEGCHLSAGEVVCTCKPGFIGPLCQDKEVITVTCDPFRIREVEGSMVDFTCNFTTNSKRRLLMRLVREGDRSEKAEETTSLTKTIKLTKELRRVACEVVDSSSVTWAVIYCAIELIPPALITRPPPPRLISLIPTESFLCVEETASVTMSCDLHNFGQRKVNIEWRREGNSRLMGSGKDMAIRNAAPEDAGTYICSASDGEVAGAGQITLMVRRSGIAMRNQYPVNAVGTLEKGIHQRHGGDYPNYPYQMDSYQKDQADAPTVTGNQTNQQPSNLKIDTVLPVGHPKAIVDPIEVTVKPGDTVILRCNATGQEPLKFYWKSATNDYIPGHVRISHGALIFRSVRSQDAGVYYCVAWNSLGQSTARSTIVVDSPQGRKPDVEILHPEIIARPGENVNFQCKSNQTGVKYVWSRIGAMMPNSSEIRTDGLLTLYRVREGDKGTYLCSVTNTESGETTVAQAVLKLKPMEALLVPPRVTIRPKSPLKVRTGEKVRLECESIGTPIPNVTWVRSIEGVDKKLVSSPTNQAIYEIKQMSASDVGKYTCNAVSSAGRKSESMSLVIDDGKLCKENEFRCKSGDQCIPEVDKCDSEKDCRDGSDEDNCK